MPARGSTWSPVRRARIDPELSYALLESGRAGTAASGNSSGCNLSGIWEQVPPGECAVLIQASVRRALRAGVKLPPELPVRALVEHWNVMLL